MLIAERVDISPRVEQRADTGDWGDKWGEDNYLRTCEQSVAAAELTVLEQSVTQAKSQ